VTGRFDSDARGTVLLTAAGQVCPFRPASTLYSPSHAAMAAQSADPSSRWSWCHSWCEVGYHDGHSGRLLCEVTGSYTKL